MGKIHGLKAFVTWYRTKEYYVDSGWRGKWDTEGGGVLINQSIHTLDLIQWFMGGIDSLIGHVDKTFLSDFIEVEDTAIASIKFNNGARGIFYATNCYVDNSPVSIEIICENATLIFNNDLTIKYKNGKIETFCNDTIPTGEKSYWGDAHGIIIDEFYNSISENRPFEVDGESAIEAIKIIDAIYKSNISAQWVNLI